MTCKSKCGGCCGDYCASKPTTDVPCDPTLKLWAKGCYKPVNPPPKSEECGKLWCKNCFKPVPLPCPEPEPECPCKCTVTCTSCGCA